jgi:phosphopantothenoylcysteine synthetase/decarboxylase
VDCAILAAAVLDFQVMKRTKGKQSSDHGTKSLQVALGPTKKIIDGQRNRSKLLVGFKLESGGSAATLQAKVRDWNQKKKCDLVVCNLLQGISKDKHEAFVYDSASNKFSDGKTKTEIAKLLADNLELHF